MQAIFTKYITPTNTRGARIKAWCESGSVTIPYPHEFGSEEAHAMAARTLRLNLKWQNDMVQGVAPLAGTNAAYVFVMLDREERNRF
jgi:hypothetical protein